MLNLDNIPYLEFDQRMTFSLENPSPLGIVAVHGNLSPGVLISAYRQGIFPWYDDESPILWWSPDPRFILNTGELHISKSMRKFLRKHTFSVTVDSAFEDVIMACADVPRKEQEGTWIVPEMEQAYIDLHRLGYAHSVEVWDKGELVGGLYGVSLGHAFFGESMFSRVSNASKTAFILLSIALREKEYPLIDCQVYTSHLEQFGAVEVERDYFLERLEEELQHPTKRGSWREWLDLNDVSRRYFKSDNFKLSEPGQKSGG